MMQHSDYRAAILADPHNADAELRAHREACAECRAFTEQLLKFESRLERALRVDIAATPKVLPFERKRGDATRPLRRWMAIAASLVLGAAIVGGVWLTLPQSSLAAAVVAHMAGEPEAWRRTDVAVPKPELERCAEEFAASLEARCRYRQLRQQLHISRIQGAASGRADRVGAGDRHGAGA